MKKLYFLLLVIVTLTGQVAWSQCNNPAQFGTINAPTDNIPVNITTCAFGGEYSTINNCVAGSTYLFTATGGTGNFLTIRQGTSGGTVLGFGTSPVSVVCTVSGPLFLHYNTNAGCGTDGSCHTGIVQCTSCSAPPPIANDLCANALPIACGQTISATTVGATLDAVGTCVTSLNTAPGIWYTFIGDGLTNSLSLCGSGYDTKIGVFTGSCGALVCVTGNDDFCGLQSEVSLPTVLGTTYFVLVTGFSTNSGTFTLTRNCLPAIPNDACSGALNINCSQTVTGTTVGATIDAVGTCTTPLNTAPGVWYTFTGNGANITLSTCSGTTFDSKIGVFTGTCASLTCVIGNDDFCGLQSQVSFPSVFGTQYYVLVTGFGAATGAFSLTRTCVFPNETCSSAINIDCGQTINGSTAGAIADPVGTCVTALGTAPGIWYSFLGDGSPVTLATCGGVTNFDTKLGVFRGSCGGLICVTGNDDFCGVASQVSFATNFGVTYYILVTGFGTNTGNFSLTRTCVAPCAGSPVAGTISGPATACVGGTGTLTLTGFSALPGISIQWKSATVSGGPYTNIPGANGSTYNFTATGVTTYYIATVTCVNGGGFANSPQFTLTQGAPVHSSLSSTVTVDCSPGTATINGTVINGGPGLYTHTLTGPGTITANASTGPNNSTGNFTVTNLPFGTHSFVLTSTDGIGCSTTGNISNVIVKQTPVITITPAAPVICNGDIQQITASVVPPLLQTFSQSATTIIPASGIATPYPSQLTVAGLPATGVTVKSVRLGNVNHTFPDDVDIVLVSPTGQAVILMSDAGGSADAIGLDYTLDDAAAASMADGVLNPTGTYKPTNFGGGDNWPAPGPLTAPTSTTLSTFSGDPNGDWKLYVVDAFAPDAGFVGNWNITFSIPSQVVFSPTTGLYTNALATIQYTGTPINVVYAKPTATTLYTATSTVAGCTGTATVNVTVNNAPAITVQPTPATQTICPGFNVTYSITATGTGPLTYQWKQGTTNLVNNIQISGATTNTLTISNVNSTNTGSYTCVVTGVCAPVATSNAAVLNVATAPVISTQPANRTVCVGQSASFTVATVGSVPPPTIYQWEVSIDAGVTWTPLTTGGSYTATFTIPATVIGQHNSRYRVRITNNCGQSTTSASATLTVNALPTVTATALSQRICISDTLVPLSGSPVGGSWSGIGVSGFNFVPTATAVGTYNLTYTYTNAAGCTSTATVVAKVEDCPERLRLLRDDAVILFPNPNNGKFNIRINSTLYNYIGMKVYNVQGQLMNGVIVNDVLNSPVYTNLVYGRVVPIDLSHLPGGIYMVKFFFDDGVRTAEKSFRVVIAR